MDNVKAFILSQLVKEEISKDEAKSLLLELSAENLHQDVAVIGLAGRFAAATNVDEFWEFLQVERSCIRDYPQLRKDDLNAVLRNPYYAELLLGTAVDEADLDQIYARTGYMDRIDEFDARFFGIPPLEADYMDPHQRIALEVAYAALENAGYGGVSVKGSRTGVFLGRDYTNHSYYRLVSAANPMQLSGSWEGLVASRISYLLDLKGPSLMLDTACSAGNVSIHQAIQALASGDCDMALAGGINLTTTGETVAEFSGGLSLDSVESADDAVRTFDARAAGTRWAEGAGIVLLKPLNRALADRDHIRAVIKASAINNDGTSTSITAPNAQMQERVILDAWAKTDVSPETISYVEAHGTGTVLGDPIEFKGLTNAFRQHTSRRQFCGIGSLKTTMGHMVAASGVASIAKVVKSMETATLAPSANFDDPNPYINFADSPLYVNDRLRPWETGAEPRRAAINSFGFIRTNSHVVLEEAPRYRSEEQRQARYCFTVSAMTDAALGELLDGYSAMLPDSPWSLGDICYTSNLGRGHYEHRVLIVATSKAHLAEAIDRVRQRGPGIDAENGIFSGVHAVVSDKKSTLEAGDISSQAVKRLSDEANARLADYGAHGDPSALVDVATAYVRGARIDFAPIYADEARHRVPLPTYPYEKVRHWTTPVQSRVTGFAGTTENPLLGTEISRSAAGAVFETTLSVDRNWVLSDHRIDHTAVVPGTTYLEMVRAAFATVENARSMRFENVFFLVPLSVQDDAPAVVRTRLDRADDGYTFTVVSQRNGEWIPHVEGRVAGIGAATPADTVDIASIQRSATDVTDPYEFEGDTGVFQFGPRWDSVRAIWKQQGQALALLRLPDHIDDETTTYGLHPAKLDNAVNLVSQDGGGTFLPYLYKRLVLHRPMPATVYSLIRTVRDDGPDGETITYDVDLLDESGQPFAHITDYTVKRVDWDRFSLDGPRRFIQTAWVAGPAVEPHAGAEQARWALIVADTAAGHAMIERTVGSGRSVVPCYLGEKSDDERHVFTPDADGMRLLCDRIAEESVQGILFATDFTASSEQLHEERRSIGVGALFELSRALLAQRIKPEFGLKVLVTNAWQVVDEDLGRATDPYSAATAALAQVIGQEYRHLLVGTVDAPAGTADEVLVHECLSAPAAVPPRAIRGSESYVRQLRYVDAVDQDDDSLYVGGTFLVTGGAGGLGLSIAEEMARAGAERIILLGRRSLDEQTQQRIDAWGIAEYVPCDVSQLSDVHRVADRLAAEGATLTGIIHAAGVAGDGFLTNKQRSTFDAVLAPKVDGSTALLELARQHPDAFVVFFSSITAIAGGAGQGDYCSANAFMDSLAVQARSEGIPAVSINWPTWSEVGMAADHGVTGDGSLFSAISPTDGLAWLAYFVQNPATGVIPAEFDLTSLKEEADDLPFELQPEISEIVASSDKETSAAEDAAVDVRLTGLPDPNPTALRVGGIYAAVLGMAEIDAHATFQDLGGNSLMTAQLHTKIDAAFPGVVDIADLFSYATVADLAGYVDDQLGLVAPTADDAGPDGADSSDHVLADVLDEIGDAELSTIFGRADSAGNRE